MAEQKNDWIKVYGAREHNLKNIDVAIPKGKLTVITGPSGSGKSSLALDILFTEGKRRYMESLSHMPVNSWVLPKSLILIVLMAFALLLLLNKRQLAPIRAQPWVLSLKFMIIYEYYLLVLAGSIALIAIMPISAESPQKIAEMLDRQF